MPLFQPLQYPVFIAIHDSRVSVSWDRAVLLAIRRAGCGEINTYAKSKRAVWGLKHENFSALESSVTALYLQEVNVWYSNDRIWVEYPFKIDSMNMFKHETQHELSLRKNSLVMFYNGLAFSYVVNSRDTFLYFNIFIQSTELNVFTALFTSLSTSLSLSPPCLTCHQTARWEEAEACFLYSNSCLPEQYCFLRCSHCVYSPKDKELLSSSFHLLFLLLLLSGSGWLASQTWSCLLLCA